MPRKPSLPPSMAVKSGQADKQERLAQALRSNLHKRKVQSRNRAQEIPVVSTIDAIDTIDTGENGNG